MKTVFSILGWNIDNIMEDVYCIGIYKLTGMQCTVINY